MARKTTAEMLEAKRQELVELEAKAAAKAEADKVKANDKAKADAERITKSIARKTEARDTLDKEIAELSLKLAGIEFVEVEEPTFTEPTLDEV